MREKRLNNFLFANNRAQVTIFIIVAIIIIAGSILLLIFREQIVPEIGGHPEKNPDTFLESCTEDKIREAITLLSAQGGSINPILYKKFKFENEPDFTNISYLCYTQNYYIPCINQEPLLIQHLKKELKDYISDDVSACFDKLTASLNKQGYTTDAKYRGFDVKLMEKKIMINIDAEITLTKTGETSTQNDFRIVIPSRFYDSALVAQEIVSQEARFCNFEYAGYMALYPQWNIDKFRTSDSVIIYTVESRDTKEKFRFAVRGCVIPPGLY